jgi:uncharacterized membrane protein
VATISRDPDRLVLFTDAVVAIAITLLILPLVDLAREPHANAMDVVTENWAQVGSFVLSFAVIARLWLVHHKMFQHVRAYTPGLMIVNLVWMFTIVVLPFPTEIVGAYKTNTFTVVFYTGTILASSVCQSVLTLIIYRTPDIAADNNRITYRNVVNATSATALVAAALVLAALVPATSYWSLLLILLNRPVVMLWSRLRPSSMAEQ